MSTAADIPEKTIVAIIDHQFTSLIDNMSTCNSLEISGFGKFIFHKRKASNTMLKYLREQESIKEQLSGCMEEHDRKKAEIRLSLIEMKKKTLNQKLQSYENQFCTNI